jgi:hypothetical protein
MQSLATCSCIVAEIAAHDHRQPMVASLCNQHTDLESECTAACFDADCRHHERFRLRVAPLRSGAASW